MRSFTAVTRPLILLLIAGGLSACGATITVMNAPKLAPEATYPTLKIEGASDTVEIPADARAHFEKRLNEYLFDKKSGFTPGDSLTLRYRFVQYDEGNRALRYLVGFGAGKGTMTAEVTFLDKSGAELGKVAWNAPQK